MLRSVARVRRLCAVGLFLVVMSAAAPAQAQRPLAQQEVKAAFLYNLIKFVEWPPSVASNTIVIGVYGRDAYDDVLAIVTNAKKSGSRDVQVKLLSSVNEASACHIVFIAESESRRGGEILRALTGSSVLTVGETPTFIREGGLVRFYVEGNRVRFEIDSAGAQVGGLRISSQLLSLAKR